MLERVREAPAQTLALRASGTVMAVTSKRRSPRPWAEAATGLVIVIDPDFGGYFAELARGLANAALAHKSLVKLAVVTDTERMDEARLADFEVRPFLSGYSLAPTRRARSNGPRRLGGGE